MKRQRKWHKLPQGFRWLKRGEIIRFGDYWLDSNENRILFPVHWRGRVGSKYGTHQDDNRTLGDGFPVIRPITPGEQALNALDL